MGLALEGLGDANVAAVFDPPAPLDAREVHAPGIARPGRQRHAGALAERGERARDLDGPPAILVARVVDRAVEVDPGPNPFEVEVVIGLTAVEVALVEQEIPLRGERIDLQLEVVEPVAVRIEEDLEVVVLLVDERVALREGGLDVRLLHGGADVEVLVVPEDLHPGLEARHGVVGPPDVEVELAPRSRGPRRDQRA